MDLRCRTCKKLKSINKFPLGRVRGGQVCTACQNLTKVREQKLQRKASKLFRQNNPKYVTYWKAKQFGLTKVEYEALCSIGCQICFGHKKLCLDHDHATGKFRGILCARCNFGLGNFSDNQELLSKAILYLQKNLKLR